VLIENTLFGVRDKVKIAIDRLQAFEPPEGYYLAFSGGKDSQCIYHLAKEAGVKFDAHYNLTTADPPELVWFIKKNYPDVSRDRPKETMWQLIPRKLMPPTRLARYCCQELKEGGGEGRIVVTGVRWAESVRRKQTRGIAEVLGKSKKTNYILLNDNEQERMMFENCTKKGKRIVNPIIDWEDEDVWEYIHTRNIEYCKLYDEGFKRLGCIGCPMAGKDGMLHQFKRWPKFKQAYMRAFQRMLDTRKTKGLENNWETPEDVFNWWVYSQNRKDKEIEGQIDLLSSEEE
jgi:phosphoadenosine phosphosulfate reductase